MQVKIWGSRGSVPVPSQEAAQFGGNTTCLEVSTSDSKKIIIDAGTGIFDLGKYLEKQDIDHCHLFLTHYHWDHIQGLPFFSPVYKPGFVMDIYGADYGGGNDVKRALSQLFHPNHFPLELDNFGDNVFYHSIKAGEKFYVGSAVIETCEMNHPGGSIGYKVTDGGWSFVFTGDHEHIEKTPEAERTEEFIKGAALLIADGQYGINDYKNHTGWGHSLMDIWPAVALRCGVKHLVVTHHDPSYLDNELEDCVSRLEFAAESTPLKITFAKDGVSFPNSSDSVYDNDRVISSWLSEFSKNIARYTNITMILDSILSEARRISNADAGTVYLVDGDELVFSYTQNDTLFPGSSGNKFIYSNARMPINNKSIAGCAATYMKILNVPNVYDIREGATYSFNSSFDKAAGYTTRSVIAIPFVGHTGSTLGVMQLINSMWNGKIVPFSRQMQSRLLLLSVVASNAVEKAIMAEELILRMLQMSSLRDPKETASHVRRVGALAAEIYQRWAEKKSLNSEEIKRTKDKLRFAAMLHDVGKVGIPDSILKKPGKLDPEERKIMESHCAMGAELFGNAEWYVDAMARDIALHHHQKWDGTGYTGTDKEKKLSGDDIPLAARITAIADVYDALVSKRCYKDAWTDEESVKLIKSEAGKHFDPEIVESFLEILDIVEAIYSKYAEGEGK